MKQFSSATANSGCSRRQSFRNHLARRNSPARCDRKNGDTSPDEVHKSGRIRSIKDCVCGQQKTAADIEELVRSRVTFQFLMGNHRVSDKQSYCSQPSNRVKPYVIVHTVEFFSIRSAVMLSEAKHLGPFPRGDSDLIRDSSLRSE